MCKWKWKWKGTRGCFEQVPASPPSKTRETAVHFKDNHVLDRSVTLTTRLLLKPQQQRSPKPQISTYFNPDRSVFINLDRDVSVPQANEPVQTAASNILCLIWRICWVSQTCITVWLISLPLHGQSTSEWPKKHVWPGNLCTAELWDRFPPLLLGAVFYFLGFVKSSSDRHVWLIWQPSFRKARQEHEWRGMSHCATSLWHATPLHSPAERDCAVCQRRPHSFPGTRVDTGSQGELIVGGQHLLCGGIFSLLGGQG